MLIIRSTEIEDASGVAACIDAVARERHFLAATHGPSMEEARTFIEFLRESGGVHLVVLDGQTIVGWCDVVPGTYEGMTHAGRLGMGLLPAFRGQGWGRRILTSALDVAFANGLSRIELEVFASALEILMVRLMKSLSSAFYVKSGGVNLPARILCALAIREFEFRSGNEAPL